MYTHVCKQCLKHKMSKSQGQGGAVLRLHNEASQPRSQRHNRVCACVPKQTEMTLVRQKSKSFLRFTPYLSRVLKGQNVLINLMAQCDLTFLVRCWDTVGSSKRGSWGPFRDTDLKEPRPSKEWNATFVSVSLCHACQKGQVVYYLNV